MTLIIHMICKVCFSVVLEFYYVSPQFPTHYKCDKCGKITPCGIGIMEPKT